MNNLNGSEVIVFGANGLLGTKVTTTIIECGGKVIAVDSNLTGFIDKIDDSQLGNITLVKLDVTSEADLIEFFSDLNDGITGAVNCTYPRNSNYGAHFFDVTLKDFNENVSSHLGSAFFISQQCAKYTTKINPTSFSLVNISSIYGVIAPNFEIYENTAMTMPVEYAAVKSAIIHLNKYISKYVNNSCFRVNSVSPGGIYDNQPDSFCCAYRKQTNGSGMLNVSEMIGTIIFLLSKESRFITGQNIIVDDGFSL